MFPLKLILDLKKYGFLDSKNQKFGRVKKSIRISQIILYIRKKKFVIRCKIDFVVWIMVKSSAIKKKRVQQWQNPSKHFEWKS